MKEILLSTIFAGMALAAQPANAAVTIGGFTLDTGTFGTGFGVHSTGTQSKASLSAIVNQDNSSVTFSTSTGILNITGKGEATVEGDPLIENLNVAFGKAWDEITFSFAGNDGSFNLLVNGLASFTGGANGTCAICSIDDKGQNKFTLSGTDINNLAFTFSPGISTAKQFRVEGASRAVPEPATWAMMLVGIGAVGATMRRRKLTKISFA